MKVMSRIAARQIASILTGTSWMDRLDLTSPSTAERDRAALVIAETIVARLDESLPALEDANQLTSLV
jgi:hypothetical protein